MDLISPSLSLSLPFSFLCPHRSRRCSFLSFFVLLILKKPNPFNNANHNPNYMYNFKDAIYTLRLVPVIVLGFSSIAVICDLLSLHAPCSTLISSLRGRVYHVSSLIGASFMGNFNACKRFLQLKLLLHFSLLLKQTCVFLIINMATKVLKHLNIWKLSLLYNQSMQSSALSMVQRKQ